MKRNLMISQKNQYISETKLKIDVDLSANACVLKFMNCLNKSVHCERWKSEG